MELGDRLAKLSGPHREALLWFACKADSHIAWPKPLSGLLLLNKAKGIHKPAGWQHALSVRQALGSPYADKEVIRNSDRSWSFDYFQEGEDPHRRDHDYTNKALVRNMVDGIPVGVVLQIKGKPSSLYKVLGLATVADWVDGYFKLHSYSVRGFQPGGDSEALPFSFEDARQRMIRSIVARQGSGAFRREALDAFERRCAISGYDVEQGLEAAHIVPYLGDHTNTVTNCLLLRADLHTLFDRGLLSIDPGSLTVVLVPSLRSSSVGSLHGTKLALPPDKQQWRHSFKIRKQLMDNDLINNFLSDLPESG